MVDSPSWHRLHVPLSTRGEWDVRHAIEDSEEYRTLYLTEAECGKLDSLFDSYNREFRIAIDYGEEEILPAECVGTALPMAKAELAQASSETKCHGLRTLVEALELAQSRHTFMALEFDA